MPMRAIASRSAVMPSLVRFPLIQNQYVHGAASAGGSRKPASSWSMPVVWATFVARVSAACAAGTPIAARSRIAIGVHGEVWICILLSPRVQVCQ